ncbi:MAG TPA: arsenosugar biosynthesis radical SAM (seleno)protein ArsS [Ohtaekwangia sp.]|nr:arsenosugar biosynthesis radical SAM (seleno)protein ArsS [Ohtaekwangia sp.]
MAQLTKSLKARNSDLASGAHQLEVLEHAGPGISFAEKLQGCGLFPLKPTGITIFQVNIGRMCNQTCAHCHVDAGPDRTEIMTRETMMQCLAVLKDPSLETVDITGGAPEMNPDFRWFVGEIKKLNKHIIVRCNLTIIVSNKKYHDLPEFYKAHNVEVISSLPFYDADRTDRQRGEGVFKSSIEALRLLNDAGYGKDPGLLLNLVYNPSGAFLPASQVELERQFKKELKNQHDIVFNNLYCITNMPVSRYLDFLIRTGNFENYMDKLVVAFNPSAAAGVMCRNTISVGWNGFLYDCDFNQMLDLTVHGAQTHIADFNISALNQRDIRLGQHCFGCTAGAGSSCGGSTV